MEIVVPPIQDSMQTQAEKQEAILPDLSRHGAGEVLKNVVLGSAIALEINPVTNELPRLAVLTATQVALHDPVLSAAAYAGSTFLLEATGAVATAKLLDTEGGRRLTAGVQKLLGKVGIDELPNTNFAVDTGVALVAGAPAAVAVKHQQDPSRSLEANARYGTLLALGSTAVSGVLGYMGAEGIAHPNPLTIGGAAFALGALLGARRIIGEAITRRSFFEYSVYETLVADSGPQLRGYQSVDYEEVVADPKTKYIAVKHDGKVHRWPLLADLQHNTEYAARYFEERYGTEPVYCLSLPPRSLLNSDKRAQRQLVRAIESVAKEGGHIVFDEIAGEEDVLGYVQSLVQAKRPSAIFSVDNFVDSRNNTPAEVAHFEGLVATRNSIDHNLPPASDSSAIERMRKEYHRQLASEVNTSSSHRAVVIDPSELDMLVNARSEQTKFDRILQIYDDRFSQLTEEYPVRGTQKSDELASLLRKPTTLTVAQVEDDDIVAFTYIADVKDCEWLNASHFAAAYPGELVLYFPGIAADRQHEGRTSLNLVHFLGGLVAPTLQEMRIVFQCTNISKEYIPRIVTLGIKTSGKMELEKPIKEVCSYRYTGFTVNIPQKKR